MFCQREVRSKCAAIKWAREKQRVESKREREKSAHASANLLDCHEPELEKFLLTVIGDNGVWPTELSSPIFINARKHPLADELAIEAVFKNRKVTVNTDCLRFTDETFEVFAGCCYLLPHFHSSVEANFKCLRFFLSFTPPTGVIIIKYCRNLISFAGGKFVLSD